MTVNRLSAFSAKVQLSAEELQILLNEPLQTPDSPQMLRLISFMLMKAEAATGIPFSQFPVTVELLSAQDGSLAAYFTAQNEPVGKSPQAKTVRLAARFPDRETLICCCTLLQQEAEQIMDSRFYQYQAFWILTLRVQRAKAGIVHHILLEYGTPFRLSAMNRAKLAEYGICIHEKNAIGKLCRNMGSGKRCPKG
ncbi:MAG TPA: hypothetical protein DCG49_07075 [Ruminococcus sp.]|nr:hypothetical protein [Ruminococcus sp.]